MNIFEKYRNLKGENAGRKDTLSSKQEELSSREAELSAQRDNGEKPKSRGCRWKSEKTIREKPQFVEDVACVRGESSILPLSIEKEHKNPLPPDSINILYFFESPLPTACPVLSKQFTPRVMVKCRFAEPILRELIKNEVMPIDDGCPLLHLCGLLSLLPDHPHRHKVAQGKKELSGGGGSG